MFFLLFKRLFAQIASLFHLGNFVRCVLIGTCFALLLQRESDRGTFSKLDAPLIDFLREQRLDKPSPSGPVFFVSCQEGDLAETDRQFSRWPLAAEDWASVFTELAKYQAKTVAVLPALPLVPANPNLKTSLASLSGRQLAANAEGVSFSSDWKLPADVPELGHIRGDLSAIPEIAALPGYEEQTLLGPSFPAALDLSDGQQGKVRIEGNELVVPLLFRCQGKILPSILLTTIAAFVDVPVEQSGAVLGRFLFLGNYRFPIDFAGNARLRWDARNKVAVPEISLDTFKLNSQQLDKFLAASNPVRSHLKALPKSLCIVGYNEAAAQRHKLPNGVSFSAAGITAHMATALLEGNYLLDTSRWVKFGYLLVCLTLSWLLYLMRPVWAVLASISAVGGALIFPVMVYFQEIAYLSPVPALLLLLVLPWCLRWLNAPGRLPGNPVVPAAIVACLLASFPNLAEAHHDPSVTIEGLTEQIAKTPAFSELYYQRGTELLAQNKNAEAKQDFQKALELKPDFLASRRMLVQVMMEEGQLTEALADLTKAIQTEEQKPKKDEGSVLGLRQCYGLQAAIFLKLGKAAEALEAVEQAKKQTAMPDLDLYRLQSECLRLLGRSDDRIAMLKAAKEQVLSVILRNEWLEALIDSPRFLEALPFVETEMSNARFRSSWQIRRARIRLVQKQVAEAQQDLQEAVKELDGRLQMESPPYLLLLDRGLAHGLLGNLDKAKADLAKAKEMGAEPGEGRLLERVLNPKNP